MGGHLLPDDFSLRQQLDTLLAQARLNEEKMRRFDQLERRLIGATSLKELLSLLLSEYRLAFGVEYVTLVLVDREHEASRILGVESDEGLAANGLTILHSVGGLTRMYGAARGPCLEKFDRRRHQSLFNAPMGAIASVALLPLTRQNELIGSFHIGSSNPDRYDAASGTDFLERLSAVISLCLESALNQERLRLIGLTDGLTGVQNRRYFEHRCQVEINQSRRYRHPLACMFLDVDRFKRINDTYGHQTGDEVLRAVAGVIQSQLRAGDTVSRYGGEEFVVLLPQAPGHHALEIAERIRKAVEGKRMRSHAGHEVAVTISIGLAMLPGEGAGSVTSDADSLVAAADRALYQAKSTGRNRVVRDSSSAGPAQKPGAWCRLRQVLKAWFPVARPVKI